MINSMHFSTDDRATHVPAAVDLVSFLTTPPSTAAREPSLSGALSVIVIKRAAGSPADITGAGREEGEGCGTRRDLTRVRRRVASSAALARDVRKLFTAASRGDVHGDGYLRRSCASRGNEARLRSLALASR